MLLFPGDNLKSAVQAAERIRQSINEMIITPLNEPVTCSFGVVEIEPNDNFVSAFERADNHLLDAKQCGKNQVKPSI